MRPTSATQFSRAPRASTQGTQLMQGEGPFRVLTIVTPPPLPCTRARSHADGRSGARAGLRLFPGHHAPSPTAAPPPGRGPPAGRRAAGLLGGGLFLRGLLGGRGRLGLLVLLGPGLVLLVLSLLLFLLLLLLWFVHGGLRQGGQLLVHGLELQETQQLSMGREGDSPAHLTRAGGPALTCSCSSASLVARSSSESELPESDELSSLLRLLSAPWLTTGAAGAGGAGASAGSSGILAKRISKTSCGQTEARDVTEKPPGAALMLLGGQASHRRAPCPLKTQGVPMPAPIASQLGVTGPHGHATDTHALQPRLTAASTMWSPCDAQPRPCGTPGQLLPLGLRHSKQTWLPAGVMGPQAKPAVPLARLTCRRKARVAEEAGPQKPGQ